MLFQQVRSLVAALNAAEVRYLLVGGLAVIAHGYTRLTQDIDVVLDLDDRQGVATALSALAALGYRPRAPVPLDQFADPVRRREWQTDKDMIVFSLYRDGGDVTELDLFIAAPFPFADAWRDRHLAEVDAGVVAPFVDVARLCAMKEVAGRPKDREDLRVLRSLHG